ncbi:MULTISPECIES: LysR family transcriptional regulator [unclassified Actinopolyspora]|uniref:LysR family transcriptional regulator n=1 Tax=unclassified Actinopolyspora TaxID=2639451 RepID=UPI0013F61552|nr:MULTISPECIES: LysR family transcriptional regulator [unclassified Actinopolyspora]NHD15908.1 LysR family transcriptional regulator [Actinopolyspora sp. BKK2]NHE74878.1 LysR family transcriptional regulator [Actinopolyspora sp. BKK1]
MAHRNNDGSGGGSGSSGGPLELGLLRTFLAVYRCGAFSAAARSSGLSQPTVTGQVRSLEQRLGRQLFERVPKGVVPTKVADELAAEVAGPLDTLAAVAERGSAEGEVPPEPVHLAGPAEFLSVRALPALGELVERGVRLRVTTGLADELLEGLRAGRFDLVVSAVRPRGRTVTAVPLMDEEFVLVAAPAWAERLGALTPGDPGPLEEVPLITYAEDLPILRRYWRHVFGRRLTAQAAVVVPDLRGVRAAVVAGAGVTVLPRYLCREELGSGALVALLDPADPPLNTGFLAQRTGAPEREHVALVRERLLTGIGPG